jgi:amidase
VPTFEQAILDVATTDASLPFAGVPTVVKDCVAVEGAPLYQAMRVLAAADWRAAYDDTLIARLRRAGVVFLGRSSMPELQGGISTEPVVFGPTHNPWELGHSVGGSSGGSAAAVAAGLVPFAVAVDGGGSIRIPSSVCGVVGLKPSRGRVPTGPGMIDCEGLNAMFVIARSVRDTAAFLDLLSGSEAGDHFIAPPPAVPFARAIQSGPGRLRVGLWSRSPSFPPVDAACIAAAERTAHSLEAHGHYVEAAYPAALDEGIIDAFFPLAAAHIAWQIARIELMLGRALGEDDIEPVTAAANTGGRLVSAVVYHECVEALRAFARRFASWWNDYDILVTPTLAVPPYRIGALSPTSTDEPWPDVRPWIPFTTHFNITGQPAISLPMHWNDDGLPIGVQLGAAFGREDLLLQVAAQLEGASAWAERRPPVHA